MLFCAFVCSAWAGPTDLPEITEDTNNPVWYTIKNTRSNKYMSYAGDATQMTQDVLASANTLFYFTAPTNVEAVEGFTAVKIHTYKTTNLLSHYNSWTADGVVWYLHEDAKNTPAMGLHITKEANLTGWNALNDANQSHITDYYSNDAGSIFVVEKVTDFSAVIDVPAAKEAAIAELTNLASVSTIYPAATTAIAAVNAVPADDKSLAGLNAAVEAVNKVVADYKVAAYQALSGKYFTINTPARSVNGYMKASGATVIGSATAASPENIWQFEYNDGAVSVYNPYIGLYLGTPGGNSSNIPLTADKAKYDLVVFADASNADAKIKLTCDGKSVHMAQGGTLVRWDNGGASEWAVIEVTDFSAIIDAYKTATISTLDQWSTLSVVFDASLIATAKESVNGIEANGFATFATIDAQLTTVTEKVAQKYFTFKNTDTKTAARVDAYLAANVASTPKKGYGTKTLDYSAIWRLLSAGGTSFYLYNELNGLYLKNPSSGELVENASDAGVYTFEIVDANTNTAELKCGGETLHLSNTCALMSYDNNDPASRWIIAQYDFKAELQTLVTENASNHAPVPALGQYPTEAYEALVAANETATSVAEVNAAVVAFKKAKNLPVFTIDGVIAYAAGKSIYDDNDGAPNFKATNLYDKTMWWALDMTATEVGVIDEVGIYNVGTGNGFWGASSIEITETEPADEADGIFLFYTTGNNNPIHYQNDNQVIVRWSDKGAASGSAHKFTYVGNTFELNKLTDEQIAAVTNLKTVATAKAHYVNAEIGAALGQYSAGDKDAIVAAIAAAKAIEAKTVSEVIAMSVEDINAVTTAITESAATFVMNMPTAGFYRVKSMNGNDEAKKGKYWQSKEDATGMEVAAEKDAARSIVYLGEDNTITSYGCGYALNQYDGMDAAGTAGKAWTITENAAVAGAYALHRNGDSYCLSDWNGGVTYGLNDANAAWALEEVDELPVTISAAGYATFYAPVALALPEGLTAYEVTAQGEESVSLTPVNDIIPAYNGVVLQGEAGTTYNLTIPEFVPVAGSENLLEGSVAATFVESPAYVLGYVGEEGSKEVGFFTAAMNQNEGTAFLNNGFKAYLPKTGGAHALRFNFGGTTAIESVVNGINANAAIYDLSGRRVEKATKGIYIVNGKKMIVK